MLISVVFPAPLGPRRPKNSPCRTSKSMPASACTLPNAFLSCRISTAAAISGRDQRVDAVQPGQCMKIHGHVDAADLAAPFRRITMPLEDERERRGIRLGDAGEVDDRVARFGPCVARRIDDAARRFDRDGPFEREAVGRLPHRSLLRACGGGHALFFCCSVLISPSMPVSRIALLNSSR